MADYSAVLNTSTLVNYMREKVQPIFRRSVFMAGLRENGCLTFNNSGKQMEWHPTVIRAELTAADPYNVSIAFPSRNREIICQLPWRSYNLGEKITKFDKLANQGSKVQFVKLVDHIVTQMSQDFTHRFGHKLYVDGNAAATSRDIHGLQSCTSNDGTVTGYVGDNDDTYAEKSTALGDLGGDWSGTWPAGTGDYEYHAWTPMIVDVNNSNFSGDTWKENWQEAMNFLFSYMGRLNDREPDVCILNTDWVRQAKDSLTDYDRFEVSANTRMSNLGHKGLLYNGVELYHEYACPSSLGFCFNWDNLELRSMQSDLIGTMNDFDIESTEDLKALDFYGNMQIWLPSGIGVLAEVSDAGT